MAGLTKRDIQLFVDGGFHTVEAVAYTPRMILERIKGISEQKASKMLLEGMLYPPDGYYMTFQERRANHVANHSIETRAHGLHDSDGNACETERTH